jgi:hypothetical protein
MGDRVAITPEAKDRLAEAFQWYESKEAGLGHEFLRAFGLFWAGLTPSRDFPSGEGLSERVTTEVPLHFLLRVREWLGDCLPDFPLL